MDAQRRPEDHFLDQLLSGARSVALIANGAIHDFSLIASLISTYDRRIAVDGGLAHCLAMGIQPDLVIGDFDSISTELLAKFHQIPALRYPQDKNETDMELAIWAAKRAAVARIGIFGALERRTDHALANLYQMHLHDALVVIETERETLFVIKGNRRVPCIPGQTVSLIPLGAPASGVTTRGLKWELDGATLDASFMSISNICLGKAFDVTIAEGSLICFLIRQSGS